MVKKLFLLRHAATRENLEHRLIGSSDPPLSELGLQQADALSTLLDGHRFDSLWCSPLRRARQTAASALYGRQSRLEIYEELREIDFGKWEGCTFEEIASEDAAGAEAFAKLADEFQFPQGEAVRDFCARVTNIAQRIAKDPGESFLLISHGGVIRHLICHFLGLPRNRSLAFQVTPASLTQIELHGTTGVLTSLNVFPRNIEELED